jgi:hypothetical protein
VPLLLYALGPQLLSELCPLFGLGSGALGCFARPNGRRTLLLSIEWSSCLEPPESMLFGQRRTMLEGGGGSSEE